MTRKTLAPVNENPDLDLVQRLIRALSAVEGLAGDPDAEIRTFSPKDAAGYLGKTENWVIEQIQLGTIPFTRIGKTPRMTAKHIAWVIEHGEVLPHKFSQLTPAA